MPRIGVGVGIGRSFGTGGVPAPPPGFILLVDHDGAYLTDADGAYLMEPV